MNKNIFLIGFMGAGKTEVGKILAKKLGYNFIDSDEYIENIEKLTITEIFQSKGEEYFRKLEYSFIKNFSIDKNNEINKYSNNNISNNNKININNKNNELNKYKANYINNNKQDIIIKQNDRITKEPKHSIISTGGGMPCFDDNVKLLKDTGIVVYLKAKPKTLFERIKNEKHRPVLGQSDFTIDAIEKLLKLREYFYNEADFIIYSDGISAEGIAEEIKIFLNI
ncbi:MAG: shikimate kinase [bacterium]